MNPGRSMSTAMERAAIGTRQMHGRLRLAGLRQPERARALAGRDFDPADPRPLATRPGVCLGIAAPVDRRDVGE
jgi:hypothetical protein